MPEPPKKLKGLFSGVTTKAKSFLKNILKFNTSLAFTSVGVKRIEMGPGVPFYKINGYPSHLMGSLLPEDNEKSKFYQMYFMNNYNSEID